MLQITTPRPFDTSAIDHANIADSTKHQYRKALSRMLEAQVNPFDFASLSDYANELPTSSRAFLKSALRLMLGNILTQAKAGATIKNLEQIQVLDYRVQAMDSAIVTHQGDPERTPHWLTQVQVNELLTQAFRNSQRDHIVLALLVCGLLRRHELSELTFDNVSQIEGTTILNVRGKGDKLRRVPITPSIAAHIKNWQAVVGDGRIARAIHRSGKILSKLSASGIFSIVRGYGLLLGIVDLDPHDLRRSGARIIYNTTKDLLKVQNILGHSDSKTTLKYIGAQIDLSPVEIINNGSQYV